MGYCMGYISVSSCIKAMSSSGSKDGGARGRCGDLCFEVIRLVRLMLKVMKIKFKNKGSCIVIVAIQ